MRLIDADLLMDNLGFDNTAEELEETIGYLQDAENEVDKLQERVDDLNEIIYDLEHGE